MALLTTPFNNQCRRPLYGLRVLSGRQDQLLSYIDTHENLHKVGLYVLLMTTYNVLSIPDLISFSIISDLENNLERIYTEERLKIPERVNKTKVRIHL